MQDVFVLLVGRLGGSSLEDYTLSTPPPPHQKKRLRSGQAGSVKPTDYWDQTQKDWNKSLFILTQTHSKQIFWEITFIKPQNDT